MNSATAPGKDDAEIRRIIADLQDAICTKDIDGIMAFYADEAVTFDVKPPLQLKGKAAIRKMWEDCLPCFPAGGEIERRDIVAGADGDMAYAHWHFCLRGMGPHPSQAMWMRATSVCRKRDGEWRVVHDHVSVPFDPTTSKIVVGLEPS